VNLFLTIPDRHRRPRPDLFSGIVAAIAWAIPSDPLWLAAHVALALALAAASLTNLAWVPEWEESSLPAHRRSPPSPSSAPRSKAPASSTAATSSVP
jgi:hypothetical protein